MIHPLKESLEYYERQKKTEDMLQEEQAKTKLARGQSSVSWSGI